MEKKLNIDDYGIVNVKYAILEIDDYNLDEGLIISSPSNKFPTFEVVHYQIEDVNPGSLKELIDFCIK